MKISKMLKWSTLLLVAWFYTGEAKAQPVLDLNFTITVETDKLNIYKDGSPGYNTLGVKASKPTTGNVDGYECFVKTELDVYTNDYTALETYAPVAGDWQPCNVNAITNYATGEQSATLINLPVVHGMNFIYFRAMSPGGGVNGSVSVHEIANWFVDGRADSPKALNLTAGGEVLAIPGPDGRCNPLIVPILMETGETGGATEGIHLQYRLDTLLGPVLDIPYPSHPWMYMFKNDLMVAIPNGLNLNQTLPMYLWTDKDRYGFFETEPATPWTVLCPALPAWDLSIVSPANGALLTSLSEISGTSEPGSSIRFAFLQSGSKKSLDMDCGTADATGAWHCTVPATPIGEQALSAGDWQARVIAELGGESRMATVDFKIIDLILTVDTPREGRRYYPGSFREVTGTVSSYVQSVTICLDGDCTPVCTIDSATLAFTCDLGDLDDGARTTHEIRVTGIGPGGQTSNEVVREFVVDALRPIVAVSASSSGRWLTFTCTNKSNCTFFCSDDDTVFDVCENNRSDLPMGQNTIYVYAEDRWGQKGVKETFNWEIKGLPYGSIVVNSPEEGETYPGRFDLAAGEVADDIDSVDGELCVGGNCTPVVCTTDTTTLTFTCALGNLDDKTLKAYTLEVTGYVAGASSASEKVSFIIDGVRPVVTLEEESNHGRRLVFGISKPDSTLWCSDDGVTFVSCDLVLEFPDRPAGDYTLYVRAEDKRGQQGDVLTHTWTISEPGNGGENGGNGGNGGDDDGGTGEELRKEPPYKIAGGSAIGCSSASGAPLAMLALAFLALARRRRA